MCILWGEDGTKRKQNNSGGHTPYAGSAWKVTLLISMKVVRPQTKKNTPMVS